MEDNVIKFRNKKTQVVEQKKREFGRVLFDELLGVYSVINDNEAIFQVKIVDISKTGVLIQVPLDPKAKQKFRPTSVHSMRFYFTKNTYIQVSAEVKHQSEIKGEHDKHYLRFGMEFDQSQENYKVLGAFVEFIYQFAEHSSLDKGDQRVYFL